MIRFIVIALIYVLISGCSADGSKRKSKSKSVFEEVHIEYATHFKLYKKGNSFKLELIDPNKNSIEKTLFLGVKNAPFSIPNTKITSLSSTLNGMFSILEATDNLVGISNIDYIYAPEIRKRHREGKIMELGDESSYSVENILQSGTKLILYSGFGKEFPNNSKLKQLGITTLPIYDWRETHPLGKAEWIKLIGVLTGKLDEATTYFSEAKQKYFELCDQADSTKSYPTLLSGILIGDIWYAPAGESYMAKLFEDAGANYIYKNSMGTGSTEKSLEQILNDNLETDFWLNPGQNSKSKILQVNPKLKHIPAFAENTYCYSGNMSKFWEKSASEPHHILSDLIHIFHPEILTIDTLYFYQRVEN